MHIVPTDLQVPSGDEIASFMLLNGEEAIVLSRLTECDAELRTIY